MNIAIGYMEFSAMKHHARATGHAGTELQQNNCASVDYCIMNQLTAAIGLM